MANVGVSAVRLIDNDNDVVSVTNNKLDVNATLVAGATIDIGDVDMFLDGGTAIVGGSGTISAGTLRVTMATDDTVATDLTAIKNAVQILDDWDDSNYANVNMNIAGTDIIGGAGAVASGVQRVTLASDDPAVVDLAAMETLLPGID